MPNPQGSVIWYELMAKDPVKATTFYGSILPWTIGEASTGSAQDYRMIEAHDGTLGGLLVLSEDMLANGARPGWLMYIYNPDVDAACAAITAAGGQVHLPGWDTPAGRIAMVSDPQGAAFYVMNPNPPTPDATSDSFSPTKLGRCSWNELATSDQDGALAFYKDQFGWAESGRMAMGPMGDYVFVDLDNLPLGAVMKRADDAQPVGWTFYFRVADVYPLVDTITAGGGTVIRGPHEVPGGDHIIIGTDPEGALFGLAGGAK